jgi:hypothetical protein
VGGPRTLSAATALAIAAGTLASCSSTPVRHDHTDKPARTSTSSTAAAAICPLTGAPVPGGGGVPARPALAVKVDNYPAARPQSGLDDADVIFEEPVEGAITRLVAVFECQEATLVGPIRSARNIDVGILGQLGQPLLAHVGGINPVLANIEASPIVNLDLGAHGSVIQHLPGRVAPYSTYASTSALWGLEPTRTVPPNALFSYSTVVPTGAAVSGVSVPFSSTSNVVWQYDATTGRFDRSYGTSPDLLADGVQNSAANVIVQFVRLTYGPWLENSEGGLEVQANLYSNASGLAQVYRNGVEIPAIWHRSSLSQPTQFVDSAGQPIPLQPGVTWVELVPTTVKVTPTPVAPATSTSTSTSIAQSGGQRK